MSDNQSGSFNSKIEPLSLLPMPKTVVNGQAVVNVVIYNYFHYLPRYLVIPRSVAVDFEVVNIMIGRNCQLLREGEVPATVFAGDLDIHRLDIENSTPEGIPFSQVKMDYPLPISFDVCRAGEPICLTVRNTSMYARDFIAVFYGDLMEERLR